MIETAYLIPKKLTLTRISQGSEVLVLDQIQKELFEYDSSNLARCMYI